MGSAIGKGDRYYYGFDYIRAIGCLFVLANHSKLIEINYYATNEPLHISIGDIFFFQVISLAVPLFFVVTLFLFFIRQSESPGYFIQRLKYLISLYLFWTAVYLLYRFIGYFQSNNTDEFKELFMDLKSIVVLIMTGGGWLYFFFFSLIVLYVGMYLYMKIISSVNNSNRFKFQWMFLLLSLILIQILPFVSAHYYLPLFFWNPIAFIPYIFLIPVLVSILENRGLMNIVLTVSLLLCFVSAFLEWHYFEYYHIQGWTSGELLVPHYARLSIIFGSIAVFILSFNIKNPPPGAIQFLSKYSLGIYALHAYAPLNKVLMFGLKGYNLHALSISLVKSSILFITRLVDSIVMAFIMKRLRWFSKFV